jgi:hypothetical protein
MMLFHLKRNPNCGQHGLGFDWLDVLAIVPVAVGTEEKTWEGGQVTQHIYRDLVCRTPEGLRVLAGHDVSYGLDGERDATHEYYVAEKE